jgi:alpha-tubulin suppressor-like RCC1 family protein
MDLRYRSAAIAAAITVFAIMPIWWAPQEAASVPIATRGTLNVSISGLEKGAHAKVNVLGPHYKRVLSTAGTLRGLEPGTYHLRSQKVLESNGAESPGPEATVRVLKGKVAHATATYYFVPTSTVTVKDSQTVSISGPDSGAQTLVLSGLARAPTQGDILASGPTSQRPDGYLVKVTSATTAGSKVTADVVPATLAEAIPDGSLNLEQLFAEISADLNPNVQEPAKSISDKRIFARKFPSSTLSCEGVGAIVVTPSLNISFTGANASVEWNWLKTSGSVSLNYSIAASLNVDATTSANCSADIPIIQGAGPTIVVDVGIPIALTPTYSVALSGSASASGGFDQTLGETLGVSMTAGFPPRFTSSVNPQSESLKVNSADSANVDLSLTASLGIEVDDLAGVSIDAGPAIKFSSDANNNPWWTLQGCIEGGFTANIFDETVINESTALSWCKNLAQAAGSPPTTTTTNPTTALAPLQLSIGMNHACLLATNGTVKCWGNNDVGELGNGTKTDSPTPVTALGLSSVKQISAGVDATCAVTAAGAVECWGVGFAAKPQLVPGLSNVIQVTVGGNFECALLSSGSVECWGFGSVGQLGDGSTAESTTPVKVKDLSGVSQISSSLSNACALLTRGTVECWGANVQGELGDGTTSNSSVPVQVSNLSGATSISTNDVSTCALLSTGSISCWGSTIGEVIYGGNVDSLTPVAFSEITQVSQVANGSLDTCLLLTSGVVECFGPNPVGELGNGTTTGSESPVEVSSLSGVTAIAAGNEEACAALNSGQVDCWGDNQYGELGNGTTTNSSVPVAVSGT